MSALAAQLPLTDHAIQVGDFGRLRPMGRLGGQGRIHRPDRVPPELGVEQAVVKLYRRPPSAAAALVLRQMVGWRLSLSDPERHELDRLAAWPLTVVYSGLMPVGIAMADLSARFSVPFVMPSGRRDQVLLSMEHLLGADRYLRQRGLCVDLDTATRAAVAVRVCAALACLHRHGIVVGDLAPSNLLVAFGDDRPAVCFIDCDSMVFRGRRALPAVETGDWTMPPGFGEGSGTRAADVYKIGLLVLRLFARSHDARGDGTEAGHVPDGLRIPLMRSLARDPANRPPAGEWQRALEQALFTGDLNRRHPGPPERIASPATPARQPSPSIPGYGALTPRFSGSPHFPGRAPRGSGQAARGSTSAPPPGPAWLRPTVAALWLIAGTAVLALILTRIFAGAIPAYGGGAPAGSGRTAITQSYLPGGLVSSARSYGSGAAAEPGAAAGEYGAGGSSGTYGQVGSNGPGGGQGP